MKQVSVVYYISLMWHSPCMKKMFIYLFIYLLKKMFRYNTRTWHMTSSSLETCGQKKKKKKGNLWALYSFFRAAIIKCHRLRVEWDQTTEIYLLTARKSRSPGSGCQQGCFHLRPLCLACRRPLSSHVSSLRTHLCPNLLFVQGHQSYWIKAHPYDLILP